MKILVISQYYYPENFQINGICEQFVKDGHEVTVLTGLPNYPTGIIPREYLHGARQNECINGVRVIRCYEIGRKPGAIGMAKNYLSFMISSVFKSRKINFDFDIIFVYQLSPVLMAVPGKILKKRYRIPMFLYCCDLWPESMKVIIKKDNNILYNIIKRISTLIYRSCDKIAVQSAAFFDYFEELHNIPKHKLCYIPQFADDVHISKDFSPVHDDTVHFVFLGNIGLAQNVELILDAAEMIKSGPAFCIHFVGDGAYLETAKRAAKEKGLDHIIRFYGRRPPEEMPTFYKMADACLLTLKADNLIGYTIPSKLQGYMAAGKTIIGAINGPAKEIIEKSGCGLCVEANDCMGFAESMRTFIIYKEKFMHCGENGRDYFINHFSKEKHINTLYAEFDSLIKENSYVS